VHSRKEICMPRTKTKVPKVDLLCASAYALTSLHTACVSPPRNSTIYTKAFLCLIYENEFRRGQETRRIQIRRESSIFVCFRCLSAAFSFSGVSASASGVSYREESFFTRRWPSGSSHAHRSVFTLEPNAHARWRERKKHGVSRFVFKQHFFYVARLRKP